MKTSIRNSLAVSVVVLLTRVANAQPTTFADGFEGQSLDPFWLGFANQGSITFPSVAQVHGGLQAVQFNSPAGVNNAVGLQHEFSTEGFGTVSVWVFDTGADSPLYPSLSLVLGFDGTPVAALQSSSSAGNYLVRVGPLATTIETSIDRTVAWHQFSIMSIPGSLTMSIDGTPVYSGADTAPFRQFGMYMDGGPTATDSVSYWDDFSIAFTPVPEPSTLALCGLAVAAGIGTRKFRRPSSRNGHHAAQPCAAF